MRVGHTAPVTPTLVLPRLMAVSTTATVTAGPNWPGLDSGEVKDLVRRHQPTRGGLCLQWATARTGLMQQAQLPRFWAAQFNAVRPAGLIFQSAPVGTSATWNPKPRRSTSSLQRLAGSLVVALAATTQAQEPTVASPGPVTWVFLNTGPSRTNVKSMTPEAIGKMQAEHVGNLGNQFDRGTLIAAGPLGDNGFIRGTVVLAVQTPEQIAECFKPDPFVQSNILAIEAHSWLVERAVRHP